MSVAAEIGEEIPGARGGQTGGVPEQPRATTRLTEFACTADLRRRPFRCFILLSSLLTMRM